MVESDRSETENGDMDRLQLSSDSIDSVLSKKKLRVEDSEDEIDLPVKRQRNSFGERSKMLKNDNTEIVSEKNNTDKYNVKEDDSTLCVENEQNIQEISESDMNKKKQHSRVKQENENKSILDENNIAPSKSLGETNIKEEIVEDMVITTIES